MSFETFGTYTNVVLTLSVALFGVYWLLRPINRRAYRHLAYCYWWCSWFAWVIAWLLILIQQKYSVRTEIPTLVFDNLNSLFLITVYFIVTRGKDLSARDARTQTIRSALTLAAAFGAIYILFRHNLIFAYEIHRACSLCVSVVTPILVGWAFKLRFKTSIALMVGCIYGIIQPILYATELGALGRGIFDQPLDIEQCSALLGLDRCHQINNVAQFNQALASIRPIVAMVGGFLKVVWAISFTQILSSYYATSENLIMVDHSKGSAFMDRWWPSVAMHATVLTAIYVALLIMLALLYIQHLVQFAVAIGFITGLCSLWQIIWAVWTTTTRGKRKE